MRSNITIGLLCVVFFALGCAPTARFASKEFALPDRYDGVPAPEDTAAATLEWRTFFSDTLLQGYIFRALENNYSFRNAMERIAVARNEVALRRGALFPSVSVGAGASLQRFGTYTMDGVGNRTSETPIPDPYLNFTVGVGFQWEADIWGKLNNRKKAALSRWTASTEAVHLAQTVLIAELAANYFELIGLDRQQEIIRHAIAAAESSYEWTVKLKEEGEVTQLAVDQFEAKLLDLRGMLLDNDRSRGTIERAMCMLMGVLPRHVERVPFDTLDRSVFSVPLGVPTHLLRSRPDIKSAEQELAASRYDVAAARKAFFPSLTLGGSGGFNAFDVSKWFVAPASLVYDLALGLTAPIFNRNELTVAWNNANSAQRIALNNYHETILKAYNEVVGLVAEGELIARHKELQCREVEVSLNATRSANELFRLQYIGYLEVLAAEQEYINSQLGYAELITRYSKVQADLFRALGGGVL